MTLGQPVTAHLGTLHFGGHVIMVCASGEAREYAVELPCGMVVRVDEVQPGKTG